MPIVRGRCVALPASATALIHGEAGLAEVTLRGGDPIQPGDLVVVDDGVARLVTRPTAEAATLRQVLDPRRLAGMAARDAVERGIRAFFDGRGFREVRTPLVVAHNATEPHIDPVPVAGRHARGFLRTSPELAMKRLLVGGLERIWQLASVFRDEPDSRTHRAEFTLLEWYRAWAGLDEIMRDAEELVASLPIRGIDVTPPWPRLRVRDLFREHAGVDLVADDLGAACARLGLATSPDDSWDDRYFRIWLAVVEPRLPDRAVFVTRYPASQAALALVTPDPDGTLWTERFEIYAGGLELGNAFAELTDPAEQRRRFTEAAAASGQGIDEEFLAVLAEGMPPSGGIAVGVDRLAMLLAGEKDIAYVRWA